MFIVPLKLFSLFIKWKFPRVRSISTDKLCQWLDANSTSPPLLFDARSEAEYAVSHLQSAMRVEPYAPDLISISQYSKDTQIVVYCSVGYRSALVTQELQQAGYTNVFNLSGGIFQWANEKRPLFKDSQPTNIVHPYNARWGKLLKKGMGNGE